MVGTKLGTVAHGTAGRFRVHAALVLRHKSRHKIPRGLLRGSAARRSRAASCPTERGQDAEDTFPPVGTLCKFLLFFFWGGAAVIRGFAWRGQARPRGADIVRDA